MKHEVSTYLTKKLFADSLKAAMKEKPFSRITVSEIIHACGVNRKTFYYHFTDIYDLLKWMFQQEALGLVKYFDLVVSAEEAITFIMDYVEQNDHIINCAQDALGSDELKRFFTAGFLDIAKSIIIQAEASTGTQLEPGYRDFLCQFYVGAVSNMLTEWARNRDPNHRQAILEYCIITIRGSILGISQLHKQLKNKAINPDPV